MKSFLTSLQDHFNRFIADPQLSQIELMRKQVAFYWTIGSVISIVILTVLAYSINAHIIGHFGIALLGFYFIEIPLFRKHNYDFYQSIFLAALILTSFIFILIFGGYTNSAGLVFVGLTCVISSILNKSVKVAFALFFLYISTILALAVLDPYLRPHPDITPKINFIFFIINTIWMSGAMMFFIIEYVTQRNRYQVAETNRLQELDDAKSQLFTSITHEFRTPITLISGLADQIPLDSKATSHAVAQIKKQSDKLLHLVNQILDLSQIDSNTLRLHPVRGEVIRFLKYVFESFYSAAEAKGIHLNTKLLMDDLEMDFDPEKLEAIVMNLISNAIKFTPKGGSVDVSLDFLDSRFLEITVRDTGIGIAHGELGNVFKRFYQVKTDDYYEGNGIGLTIVREYVHLAGGEVTVESKPGGGTTFKVLLPVTCNAPVAEVPEDKPFADKEFAKLQPEHGHGAATQPLLLIIDDHRDIIDYLHLLLAHKYHIIQAGNGREGFELATEKIPDIIITDIMMPDMDGYAFLKKVKADFRTSHIPVLLLTARADRASKLEGLSLGAEAYLVKPFDKEELFIRLRKLLEMRHILRQRYRDLKSDLKPSAGPMKFEDQFMATVHQIIEANIDDEFFDITTLCRELGMSHTQLYRKFSVLTDITLNNYIKRYRLHKALKLLRTTNLNVSQVSLEVGLPNPSYFSRVFTEEFGINPSKAKDHKTTKE